MSLKASNFDPYLEFRKLNDSERINFLKNNWIHNDGTISEKSKVAVFF